MAGVIVESNASTLASGASGAKMLAALAAYSEALGPWAEKLVSRALAKIDTDARRAFQAQSKAIFRGLRGLVADDAVGKRLRELQASQVQLIKSIPTEAGKWAQERARSGMVAGLRPEEIAKDIERAGDVTEGRARVIARTETAKANSMLTQARAESVGSTGYYWRTMEDEVVRDSHREMAERSDAGEIFSWSSPPTLSDGESHHPGQFPNCRCYPEPVLLPVDEGTE